MTDGDEIQLALFRAATPEKRLELTFSFSAGLLELVHAGLKRERPDLSETERGLLFVERNYGAELASRVRAELASRAG